MSAASSNISELGLTPELERLSKAFKSMADDKMRYKQLLFLAAQSSPMPAELQTPENKVQGCLSTVFVHATMDDGKVKFQGDSDGQLTKGLVTLLTRGLSGNTPEAIQSVKPDFIQYAGLNTSLTPGRNNGFINMLATMKRKALELQQQAESGAQASASLEDEVEEESSLQAAEDEIEGKPIISSIRRKLNALQPRKLVVEDESGDEQKVFIAIVSEAFQGLPLVKRHQLVHMTMAEEMAQIHAVQLSTKTPAEVGM
jgi:sulfur transfer protein SufE/stress-induced morphogen